MDVQIRLAESKDIPFIFGLVKELAAYENAEDQVWTSEEIYFSDFKKERFRSIVAIVDGKVIGTCIYYPAYSTWKGKMMYLEDFIVEKKFRRLGIGQKLFDAFMEQAKKEECKLIKWEVLDWNETAINFYKKNKALIKKNWWDGIIIFNS